MKKQFILAAIFTVLTLPVVLLINAQQVKLADDGEEYWISLGTNKVNAVSNDGYGEEGYKLNDTELKVMGFFRRSLNKNFVRATKLDVNKVAIVIKHGAAVLDSQVLSCNGIHSKWRDFYVSLKDVHVGNDYMIYAYDAESNNLLTIRNFIIANDKVPEFVRAGKPFIATKVIYTDSPPVSTTNQGTEKTCEKCEGSGRIYYRQNKTWEVVKSTNTDGSKKEVVTYSGYGYDSRMCSWCLGTGKRKN